MDDTAWPRTVRRARDLVMAFGWNATAYQIVNPGIEHWFARSADGVVGFVRHSGIRVVAGAPVAAETELARVAEEFEDDARRAGEDVCYFAAERRLEEVYRGSPRHSRALLGAQPAWTPDDWCRAVAEHRSLKAQFARARNKGIRVSEWPPDRAMRDGELRAVLARWLATRRLPTLHFLVEPDTLARLEDRRVFVAVREWPDESTRGTIVGFVVASPVPCRQGWLIEQFVRDPHAPNGTVELLLDHAAAALGREGARYLSLGLAPLARRDASAIDNEPPWLRFTLAWVRAHGRRFYDFDGLERFKAKFRPTRWEPVYAIANTPGFTPKMLYAIAGAFGAGPPPALLAQAIGRAIRQEVRWLLFGRASS
jgi:phosphatidylglycerol lysyltransferase